MNNNNTVQLFSKMQIWYHKHLLHFMFILILTGTPLVSSGGEWIAYVIGVPFALFSGTTAYLETVHVGIQVCRIIHRATAFLWIIISIPFILNMLPKICKWDMLPRKRYKGQAVTEYVKESLVDVKTAYIDYKYPKYMGKYNIMQMLAGWTIIIVCIAMIVSGVLLVAHPYLSQPLVNAMRMLHLAGYCIMILFLIVHIYLAVHPVNRAGYIAMFGDGKDSKEHAKKKHPGMFASKSEK